MDASALQAYYEALPREGGFDATCAMALPDKLTGACVLDLGCRRGKGVYKLSERVGATGFVVGVDPSADNIKHAVAHMDDAWRKSGLLVNNMQFLVGFPEDLAALGIEDCTFHLVFLNSMLNVAAEPAQVLRETARVLRPGGCLQLDTVVAEGSRDANVIEEARALGNVVQSAPARATLERMLLDAGFANVTFVDLEDVAADTGFLPDHPCPMAPTCENVHFTHVVVAAIK